MSYHYNVVHVYCHKISKSKQIQRIYVNNVLVFNFPFISIWKHQLIAFSFLTVALLQSSELRYKHWLLLCNFGWWHRYNVHAWLILNNERLLICILLLKVINLQYVKYSTSSGLMYLLFLPACSSFSCDTFLLY